MNVCVVSTTVTVIKDLDVIINYNMSFHVHVANIVNEAYKRLGFETENTKHLYDIYMLLVFWLMEQ
jgi:hypothetical protein